MAGFYKNIFTSSEEEEEQQQEISTSKDTNKNDNNFVDEKLLAFKQEVKNELLVWFRAEFAALKKENEKKVTALKLELDLERADKRLLLRKFEALEQRLDNVEMTDWQSAKEEIAYMYAENLAKIKMEAQCGKKFVDLIATEMDKKLEKVMLDAQKAKQELENLIASETAKLDGKIHSAVKIQETIRAFEEKLYEEDWKRQLEQQRSETMTKMFAIETNIEEIQWQLNEMLENQEPVEKEDKQQKQQQQMVKEELLVNDGGKKGGSTSSSNNSIPGNTIPIETPVPTAYEWKLRKLTLD